MNDSIAVKGKFILNYLPEYAMFLLQNHLEAFVTELLRISREEDIPMLRYFSSFTDNDLLKMGMDSNSLLLSMIGENKIDEYVQQSSASFIENQLPILERDDILIDDITLVSFVRRKAFRLFLDHYTSDVEVFSRVMEDVDRFTTFSEASLFNAYNNIQQEKISRINQKLELRYNELLEAQHLAEMGSFFWDIKGGQSEFTPGTVSIFDLEDKQSLETFFEHVHPGDKPRLKTAIDQSFTNSGLFDCEYTYRKNGNEKRIWSRGYVSFEDGTPVNMKGTVMDITKKHTLLARLQKSEELHKQAQALTHIGNWSWNIADNKIVWSDEMYRIYGLVPQSEQITFERFISLIHPDDREKRMQEIQQALETRKADDYILKIINPDGKIKILKGKGEVVTDENNLPAGINGTCQDITKEYLLNKDLKEKKENLKQLINNAPDGVIVINAENIIRLWNPKAEEIFGWTADEVIGRSITETIKPEKHKEAHESGMKRFLQTGEEHVLNKTLELEACNKNGHLFYISLTVSETTQDSKKAFIAFIRDISQQKNTQLELQKKSSMLEYKNVELERINQELESFNFAASHDLQEPLRKIHTYSNRITESYADEIPSNIAKHFGKIISAASRMQKLIADLLSFSQNTLKSKEVQLVDLNALMEEVKASVIDNVEESNVQLNVDPLPDVKVVHFQFQQLFINLLSNAIKYKRSDVAPKIKIESRIISSSDIDIKGIFPGKNFLKISVADNGIGFDTEYSEEIFNLFTRLHSKDKYSGTGIGLAICKKIVHNHDGLIKAESRPGEGSTFFIYLPEHCIVNVKDKVKVEKV